MADKYASLLNKYNRLFAQAQDLHQQLNDKTEHARRQNAAFSKTTAIAKTLCKDILAKDPQEMVLGRAYSWDEVDIDTLLMKSLQSFRDYNAARTELLRRLKDESEERRIANDAHISQIETLKFENRQLQQNRQSASHDGDEGDYGFSEEDDENIEASSRQPDEKAEEAIGSASYDIQEAHKSGAIDLIIEEDGDLTERDMSDIEEAMEMAKSVSIQAGDIPIAPSKKKRQHKADKKQKDMEAYVVDLAEIKSQITSYMWPIVEAIGGHGISKYVAIETKTFELWEGSEWQVEHEKAKRGKLTNSRIRMAVQYLAKLGVIEDEKISDPLQSHFLVYHLTPMGTQIYNDKYEKRPVLSEWDKLVADHDNAEHGYGIISIAEMFESSGFFTSVTSTKKDNRIKIEENLVYEPDIITVGSKFTSYFEYERGYHNQTNFNIKLNKMSKVTNVINILVPTKQTLLTIQGQVEKWIESRGGNKALYSKKVRISTVRSLVGKDPHRHDNWQIVYDMKSDKPTINTSTGDLGNVSRPAEKEKVAQ